MSDRRSLPNRRSRVFRAGPVLSLFTAFALLAPAPSSAQDRIDLRGRVVEMGSARPLGGAEILLPALDRWAISNEDGAFVIKGLAPGRYRVEVSQLGYRKHEGELVAGADPVVTLELWPDPVVLEGLTAQVGILKRRRNAIPSVVRTAGRAQMAMAVNMESTLRSMGETLVYCGSGDYCLLRRGRPVAPRVYIDERPAFGMDELNAYLPSEFHTIEVIGHSMIRAYTVGFMERLALGRASLFPVLF
ncbi:MAG TPA: carboxypeptidase-like regulatory domain-containing protein [Gemmatimonadaceae bacterium]